MTDSVEQKMSVHEDGAVETIQNARQRERESQKKRKKWANLKQPNGVSKENEIRGGHGRQKSTKE